MQSGPVLADPVGAEERVDPFAVIRTFGKVPFECQRTFPRKEKVHLGTALG